MSEKTSNGGSSIKRLALLLVAVGLGLGLWIAYEMRNGKPRLFYAFDDNHYSAVYDDHLGTFIYFDHEREFVVVIVTNDPDLSYHGYHFNSTYDSATLLAGSPYETRVAEAEQKLLICLPGDQVEFPISQGWISAWGDSLKIESSLRDLNLLAEIARALNPTEQAELQRRVRECGLSILETSMDGNPIEPDPPAYTEGFLEQDYEKVHDSLLQDPAQARLVFGNLNTTLLHAAAYDGAGGIVEQLIKLGADVNARETSLRTPLHHAANNGHIPVIEVLVRHGADLEARDAEGLTPLMWARISRTGEKEKIVAKLLSLGAVDEPQPEQQEEQLKQQDAP